MTPPAPKSLAEPAAVVRRRALASAPHIDALRPVLDAVRAERGEVPDPDPLDGGAGARLLLLLETPGPGIRRTGFVSRDNPAETAANLFRFLREARISRHDSLIWNVVPWIIHGPGAPNRAPSRAEVAHVLAWLPRLLDCLPCLEVVVLAGRAAAQAEPRLLELRPDLAMLRMPHPSPTYLSTGPAHPLRCREVLAEAARLLAADARASAA